MFVGIVAGVILMAATLVTVATFAHATLLRDLVGFGLGVIVAPVAAGASAMAMRASPGRVFGTAGFAFLLAFTIANLVDYGLTMLLFMPDAPGPFQGREWTAEDVIGTADVWLLGRHLILCFVGLVGGAALGIIRRTSRGDERPARPPVS